VMPQKLHQGGNIREHAKKTPTEHENSPACRHSLVRRSIVKTLRRIRAPG